MTYWFTSDWHIDHSRIISYSGRPFTNSFDMHQEIVKRFNEVVKPDDHAFIMGDMCFGSRKRFEILISELKCKNLYFIKGNHKDYVNKEGIKEKFKLIADYHELWIQDPEACGGKQLLILFHYPIESWNQKYHKSIHLFGHSHGRGRVTEDLIRRVEVCVENWNYYPVSYEQVKQEIYRREVEGITNERK